MTDEERIIKEKASVEAMRNAKANMTEALARIDTLERTLSAAISYANSLKAYVPSGAYPYRGEKSVQDIITENVAKWSAVI